MALELIKPHSGFFGYLLLLFPVKAYCLSIGFHGHAEIPPEGERTKNGDGVGHGNGNMAGLGLDESTGILDANGSIARFQLRSCS